MLVIQDEVAPTILYDAMLIPVALLASGTDVQSLWYCRKEKNHTTRFNDSYNHWTAGLVARARTPRGTLASLAQCMREWRPIESDEIAFCWQYAPPPLTCRAPAPRDCYHEGAIQHVGRAHLCRQILGWLTEWVYSAFVRENHSMFKLFVFLASHSVYTLSAIWTDINLA